MVILIAPLTYLLWQQKELIINNDRLIFAIILFLYVSHLSLPLFGHEFHWAKIILFLPSFAILLFPGIILHDIYRYFRKLILFFSVISVILFILLLIGVDYDAIPHYRVEGFTPPMKRFEHYYRVYGLVVCPTNALYRFDGILFSRVCGPFQEPGHFAIFLGIIASIDKLLYNRVHPIIYITGLLTFSPAFLIIIIVIEFYNIFIKKRIRPKLYIGIAAVLFFGVILIGKTNRERIWYLTFGRNFGQVEKSLLDDRVLDTTIAEYSKFVKTPSIIMGKGARYMKNIGVMSDFRGLIFKYGIYGFTLSLLLFFLIFVKSKLKPAFLFIPLVLLIYAHRAWMFESPYVFLFSIIAVMVYEYYTNLPKHKIKTPRVIQ